MRDKKSLKTFIVCIFYAFLSFNVFAQPVNTDVLASLFKNAIPMELKSGLRLVELGNRCEGCQPWRYINFYNNEEPQKSYQKKVSVIAGYRAMYAYPDTHYFANVKIEQSAPESFQADRKIMEEAIHHEFLRKKKLVDKYLSENPDVKQRVDEHRAEGKDYLEFEQGERNGIAFVSYQENAIGLTSSTISQIHFFVPEDSMTVTAYLLKQKIAKFNNIDEFRNLREAFINEYTEFLARGK